MDYMEYHYHIHDNNHHTGANNYFIYGQTETPYHHTGETGTRQIISSYLNKQNNNRGY